MVRIKLKILPYHENLLIVSKDNATIQDLKKQTLNVVQLYPVYKQLLLTCAIHIELDLDNHPYAIPEHYQLKDCYDKDKDIFIISFINKQQFENRQSIQMTPSHFKQNAMSMYRQSMMYHQQNGHLQSDELCASPKFGSVSPKTNNNHYNVKKRNWNDIDYDNGQCTMDDIREWASSELIGNSTSYTTHNHDYKQFVQSLQHKFPFSLKNIAQSVGSTNIDFQRFILQQLQLNIVRSPNGWYVQHAVPIDIINDRNDNNNDIEIINNGNSHHSKMDKKNIEHVINDNKNKNNTHNQYPLHPALHPLARHDDNNGHNEDNMDFRDQQNVAPLIKKQNVSIPPIKIQSTPPPVFNNNGYHHKGKKIKVPQDELPVTPDSVTEDEQDEDEENEHQHEQDVIDHHEYEVKESKTDENEQSEIQNSVVKAVEQSIPTKESVDICCSPIADTAGDTLGDNKKTPMEYLPDIVLKAYSNLCALCKAPDYISKYVVLSELEREVKNLFRDTTPYKLNIAEMDYINFAQLLMIEFGNDHTLKSFITARIVHCEKKLMCNKRGDIYEPKDKSKIIKHGKEYDKCPEIETYVVIQSKNQDELQMNVDMEIEENIKYLDQCIVVNDMSASDIYYHLKLIHSQCTMREIETELYGHGNGMGFHHGVIRNQYYNSYDQIASELRENGIDGKRIMMLKWSNWEMLHELNRDNDDDQDFIEDIMMDFFFPFITVEQLSNHIVSLKKSKAGSPSIFNDHQLRSRCSLCIDYALFSPSSPILQSFVKIMNLKDFDVLLRLHKHLAVDTVVGEYNALHIAAWRGKFKILSCLVGYGGNPYVENKQGETAFVAGRNHPAKLKWFYSTFPKFRHKKN